MDGKPLLARRARRRPFALLLLVIGLAVLPPVVAGTEAAAGGALTETEDAKYRLLLARTIEFQESAAVGEETLEGIVAGFAPNASVLDLPKLHAPMLTSFFEGAVITLGNLNAETPTVGFYNLFVDSWILTQWRWGSGGAPTLLSLSLVPGEYVRGDPLITTGAPIWLGVEGEAMFDAMRAAFRVSILQFERSNPLRSQTPSPLTRLDTQTKLTLQEIVRFRMTRHAARLLQCGQTTSLGRHLNRLVGNIRRGDGGAIARAEMDATGWEERIELVPEPLRRGLAVFLCLPSAERSVVFFGPSRVPRWYYVAFYDTTDPDEPRLLRLALHDLAG